MKREDGYGSRMEQAVVELIGMLGDDPKRTGLEKTPYRVVKAMMEMTDGYKTKPEEILATRFEVGAEYDQVVLLKDIRFTSLCEHHMLPFSGVAHVGYVPKSLVVGLSKLARLVHCFAKRLQMQERLTRQIADALEKHLEPIGVAVVVEAKHSCMGCRGAMQPDAVMVTSAMLGCFRQDVSARSEFMALLR